MTTDLESAVNRLKADLDFAPENKLPESLESDLRLILWALREEQLKTQALTAHVTALRMELREAEVSVAAATGEVTSSADRQIASANLESIAILLRKHTSDYLLYALTGGNSRLRP